MELKSEISWRHDEAGRVLIVPLWNRNVGYFAYFKQKSGSNRTFMELKYLG